MASIRRRLLRNQLLVGVLLCALTGAVVSQIARTQVGDLLDYQLEQVARTIIDRDLSELDAQRPEDPAMHLEIQVADATNRVLYVSDDSLQVPITTPIGLTTIPDSSGEYDDGLRVFTLRSASRVVQVIQPVSLREELAWEAGVAAVVPSLLLLAALSLLIVFTIRHELAPLERLSAELEARGADALTPVDLPDAPGELRAPLHTLNRLLARLDDSLRAHKDFVADAAHELRSPLTAIRLQAANVAAAGNDAQRRVAVAHLSHGVDRASHLVQQLLTLARMEPSARATRSQRLDLCELARHCLVDQVGGAAAKEIQLSLSAPQPAWIDGDGEALKVMLDNLVGNAIKYAPVGSAVEIAVTTETAGARIAVRDQGPGIPEAERGKVFERFHRVAGTAEEGSGLGLAIVAAVVKAHEGSIELADPSHGAGLVATVRLPAAGRGQVPSHSG